mmetsp:Transcript_58477/g.155615  ORF Transcript_58477/g.155615 Transcript_58477/m.155615 type:complete len:344 (+) Transcript_58477:238-1269(+)
MCSELILVHRERQTAKKHSKITVVGRHAALSFALLAFALSFAVTFAALVARLAIPSPLHLQIATTVVCTVELQGCFHACLGLILHERDAARQTLVIHRHVHVDDLTTIRKVLPDSLFFNTERQSSDENSVVAVVARGCWLSWCTFLSGATNNIGCFGCLCLGCFPCLFPCQQLRVSVVILCFFLRRSSSLSCGPLRQLPLPLGFGRILFNLVGRSSGSGSLGRGSLRQLFPFLLFGKSFLRGRCTILCGQRLLGQFSQPLRLFNFGLKFASCLSSSCLGIRCGTLCCFPSSLRLSRVLFNFNGLLRCCAFCFLSPSLFLRSISISHRCVARHGNFSPCGAPKP